VAVTVPGGSCLRSQQGLVQVLRLLPSGLDSTNVTAIFYRNLGNSNISRIFVKSFADFFSVSSSSIIYAWLHSQYFSLRNQIWTIGKIIASLNFFYFAILQNQYRYTSGRVKS
jgi:hypothetical protein